MTPLTRQPRAPFVIGTNEWPGFAKLIEEFGETLAEIGKLMAFPNGDHPDGRDHIDALHDELGDVRAGLTFVIDSNPVLDGDRIYQRAQTKLVTFKGWHQEGLAK